VTGVPFSLVMVAELFSHTSIVLLVRGRGGQVVAQRPRLRDHLAARWLAHRLDLALADGTSPEANVALALRAQRLTEPDRRWSTAGALRRVVREARDDRRARFGRVRPNPRVVLAASRELTDLADTLDDPGPVTARGVAQAWLLLTDGTGPLYSPGSGNLLCARAARAAQQLRPWAA
jgi:hypothetical protein